MRIVYTKVYHEITSVLYTKENKGDSYEKGRAMFENS